MSDATLLDAIHANTRRIRSACARLHDTAYALERVGMSALCSEIEAAIDGLEEGASEIQRAWGRDIDGQMAHGAAMIGGIISLVADGRIAPKVQP